jgi:hypothetical protein
MRFVFRVVGLLFVALLFANLFSVVVQYQRSRSALSSTPDMTSPPLLAQAVETQSAIEGQPAPEISATIEPAAQAEPEVSAKVDPSAPASPKITEMIEPPAETEVPAKVEPAASAETEVPASIGAQVTPDVSATIEPVAQAAPEISAKVESTASAASEISAKIEPAAPAASEVLAKVEPMEPATTEGPAKIKPAVRGVKTPPMSATSASLAAPYRIDPRHHQDGRPNAATVIPLDWQLQRDQGRYISPDGSSWFAPHASPIGSEPIPVQMDRIAKREGEKVTYLRREPDWIAVSGFKGGRIFYRKAVVACRGKVWHHIEFEYPAALKRRMDPFVNRASYSIDHAENDSCTEPR